MKNKLIQVDKKHYFGGNYDTKKRFSSYWHQIDEMKKLKCRSILEIGVGNGFVSDYLKKRGLQVTTLDIDPNLKPDVVSSVLEMPFKKNDFETISCCEVLEHMPFNCFEKALKEIKRVGSKYAVISIPDQSRVYLWQLELPFYGTLKLQIPVPKINKLQHIYNGHHYWELGKKGYPLKRINSIFKKLEIKTIKTYRILEIRHRIFVLSLEKEAD